MKINPTRLRLYQLGKTQIDLMQEIRRRGVYCARTELSETLNGVRVSPKARMLKAMAEEIVEEWERRGKAAGGEEE